LRGFLGRVAIVSLLIVLFLVAVQGVLYWQVRRQLQTRIRKLQRQNMPVTIAELSQPTLSEDKADAELDQLRQVFASLEKIILAVPTSKDGQRDIAAQNVAFRRFVLQYPDLIVRLRNASRLPIGTNFDFPLKQTPFLQSILSRQARYRRPSRALAYDAELELAEGSTDQAARDAMAILRWGEHASHQPALINYLVSVAIDSSGMSIAARCIAEGDLSTQVRADLLNDVLNVDASAMWKRALISERAVGISSYRENLGAMRHLKSMVADQSRYLDLVEDYLQAGQKPFGKLSLLPAPGASLSASVEPAFGIALDSLRRLQSQQRAVLILAAWKDSGEREDLSIDQLPVNSSVLVDPFDGSEMKFRIATGKVSIYSVGSNLADDGGTLTDALDVGIEFPLDRP
jgi:hypothetical protein